jgi:hypothetical protein
MAYKSSINTGLPNVADSPDPKFFAEFTRIYNAIRNLTLAIDAYTGALPPDPEYYNITPPASSVRTQNIQKVYVITSTAIAYGKTVNLYNNAGVLTARLSDATTAGKHCHGFCSNPAGGASGAYIEVSLGGLCTAIGGLTPGVTYYNGNTPGTVAPSAGTVSQKVGYALSTTTLFFSPDLL